MPIPNLQSLCLSIQVVPGEVCIPFPGGAEVCVTMPDIVPPTPDKLIRQLFAQANAALAPLNPIFNIIDTVVAVFDCIKAISTLNPEEIIACIPNLAQQINKLLQLIPVLSIPFLVAALIDTLILYLRGTQAQLRRAQILLARLLDAETAAVRPGNVGLGDIVDCAFDDLNNLIAWQNECAKPVNRLIGVINLFLEIIGLERFTIPCLGTFIADLDAINAILEFIDLLIELLTIIRLAIPVFPPLLPQVGGVAQGC